MKGVVILKGKGKYFMIVAILIIIFVISSFSGIINFITDYKWFSELGYTKTFLTKLRTQLMIGIPSFLIIFFLTLFYLIAIKKKYYKDSYIIPEKKGEKRLNVILGIVSAFISFFISTSFAGNLWFKILQFTNSTDFNVKDPIFNNDLSLYIFKLPLLKEVISLILLLLFIFAIVTVAFYALLFVIRRPNKEGSNVFDFEELTNKKEFDINKLFNKKLLNKILTQVAIIGFLVFIIIAVNNIFNSYELLYSTRGKVHGASYTDIHVTLWVYRIMAVAAVVSGIGFLVGVLKKNKKLALFGPILLISISILGNIGASIVENYIVKPDQISKEEKYLKHNIEFTQRAYGLKDVTIRDFPVNQDLTKEDLLENEETIKNIRINDYRPTKQVYYQLQGIRQYYTFNDIDVDRYNINDKYTQVFLSARELDKTRLDEQAKNWINLHLKYTHGYGLALSPVNSVTEEGQPELLVKNIPPTTDTNLKINRPEIYFGEMTNDFVVVNTDEKEFDYPQGSNNKSTIYEGSAGIELDGLNKLLFAIKQRDLKLLISGNINSDSRIVLYRNIKERVRKIAPFIDYSGDPYLVLNQQNGKLYWIMDGFTLSSKYPYSEPYKDTSINYIRNSVKVVIDAYNGDANYYVFDEKDPIVSTYSKIFSDLFKTKDQMPEGLKNHVRYPTELFNIQSDIYRAYHMDNPEVFFSREDYWTIANEKYMEETQKVEPNYVMFKLPEEEKAEFLLTIPYTPDGKDNMTALFVARNDKENYGNLVLYKFPKNKNIPGPMLIESQIDQDSEISPQLSLWDQKGSNVLRGNLLVIPIQNSLLYVEPIYLKASNENSLPQVKRVIVSYNDKIVMEKNLDTALSKLFGTVDTGKDDDGIVDEVDTDKIEGDIKDIIDKANDLFNKAKEASQEGNWAEYGNYIEQLEKALNQLNNVSNEE